MKGTIHLTDDDIRAAIVLFLAERLHVVLNPNTITLEILINRETLDNGTSPLEWNPGQTRANAIIDLF